MENNSNFIDPLDALIKQHQNAINPSAESDVIEQKTTETQEMVDVESTTIMDTTTIDYGENDLIDEIKREEELEKQLRDEAYQKKHEADEANKKAALPPQSLDKEFQAEAIGFQADKLEIVASMIKKVIAKNNIHSGGIDPNKKMHVMGDLVDIYHNTGEVITPEFEQLILSNWISDDEDNVNTTTNGPTNNSIETTPAAKVITKSNKIDSNDIPIININVEKNTPVTVNVDESITHEINKSQKLNIYVKEVTEKELKTRTIIENSNKKGLIKPYDSGINDVVITLPMSGYRCVMRPINWFDFIKLSAPTSDNAEDNERRKWSVIYDHIKNPSIGEFANFEDFLKKTKYSDRELLMWAILVGTADEEESISMKCSNPKCRTSIVAKYRPRNIIRLDENKIPKYYHAAHNASPGEESYKIWQEVAGSRRRYQLPNTKIIVEINEPSAYEFITEKLALTQEIYERYRPGEKIGSVDLNDPAIAQQMVEFEYLVSNALLVSAMTIIDEEDSSKEYRYTNWEDIEDIITTMLDAEDSAILLQVTAKAREIYVSPVTFRLDNIECESCKHVNENLVIDDIAESLLFQVSRRLASTDINLIEMQ